jgi:hypothetical protein
MGEHEDLGRELKKEWFGRRAQQINEELTADFNRYIRELHPGRVREILEAGGHKDGDEADITAIAAANTAATAEGLLVALSMYLARQEANTPPPE